MTGEVNKHFEYLVTFRISKLPEHGYMVLGNRKAFIGMVVSLADIRNKNLKYVNVDPVPTGSTELLDSFEFTLFDEFNNVVLPSSYSECLALVVGEVPSDGVYKFDFVITKQGVITIGSPTALFVEQDKYIILTQENIPVVGSTTDKYIQVLTSNGNFMFQGNKVTSFDLKDLALGKITYTSSVLGLEVINYRVFDSTSNFVDGKLTVTVTQPFLQLGDNIIYKFFGSTLSWDLSTNEMDVLWSIGNVIEAPDLSVMPTAGIIPWLTYSPTNTIPADTPARGDGYNKLPQFRNLEEKFYFSSDLPEGIYLSSVGYLKSSKRVPDELYGEAVWLLPKRNSSFEFELTAVDTKTGISSKRKYRIIMSTDGTNGSGITSESVLL